MTAAAMAWRPLSQGDGDVQIRAGSNYAIVASLKSSHTRDDVAAIASSRGLTLYDYGEQGQRAGLGPDPNTPAYRYVAVAAHADRGGGSIPWSAPWPLSLADSSHIVSAWEDDSPLLISGGVAVAPSPPSLTSKPKRAGLIVAAAATASAAAVWWWYHRR